MASHAQSRPSPILAWQGWGTGSEARCSRGVAPTRWWLLALLPLSPLHGQTVIPTYLAGTDNSTKLTRPSTYINDSFEAREDLARAANLAERGLWRQAARAMLDVYEAHADQLIEIEPGHYEAIPTRINRTVASWPAAGVAAYRSLCENDARERFQQSLRHRDIEGLLGLLERYFCTRVAVDIGDAAAQLAIERGDFALARCVYDDLLELHPDRRRIEPNLAQKLAVTFALWGRADSARAWEAKARHAGGQGPLLWKGVQRELGGVIDECLASAGTQRAEPAGFVWPLFGGDAGRNRVIPFDAEATALLWKRGLRGDVAGDDLASGHGRDGPNSVAPPSVFPIVFDGLILASDGQAVWAVSARSGASVWMYEGFASVTEDGYSRDRSTVPWHSVAVEAERAYACLQRTVPSTDGREPERTESLVVCLDARSGQKLWSVDGGRLGAAYSETCFDAAPIGRGGQVYVVVRRKRAFGFEDAYLCRIDGTTGDVKFQTHVGGGSTGGFGFRRGTMTIPALVDSELYVMSNLGTVTAVSAHRGRVRWLRAYESLAFDVDSHSDQTARHHDFPWQYTPALCSGETLICLPLDSASMLVLDRRSGKVLHTALRETLAKADTILGVVGDRAFGLGDGAFCYDFVRGEMVWRTPFPSGTVVSGRGTVTTTSVHVPTRDALCAFDADTGTLAQTAWGDERPGNLLATPGTLLVTGSRHMATYACEADVRARLREAMEVDPGDPMPALELAEVAMRARQAEAAVSAVEEAVRRTGGLAGPVDTEIQRRIFDRCMVFSERLAQTEPVDPGPITRLYEIASRCAPDAAAHVRYRLRFASFHESVQQLPQAVALYQQILADRSLAEFEHKGEAGRPVPAGRLAAQQIDRLIRLHGRGVYARYDEQAAKLLAAGRTRGDVTLLERVAEEFANSTSAADALVEKGRLLQRVDQPIRAAKAFQRALSDFPRQVDGAEITRHIADCYSEAGRPEHAWRWLTRGMREYPAHRLQIDGARLTFAEYRRRLGDVQRCVEPVRPRIDLPLAHHESTTYEKKVTILTPRFADSPHMRWGAYFVYTQQSVRAFEAATGSALWDEPAPVRMRPDLLVSTSERTLLATRHQIVGLDARTGRRVWSHGDYPEKLLDAQTDPESFPKFRSHGLGQTRLVSVRDDGDAVCLDTDAGTTLWRRQLTPKAVMETIVSDPWVVCQAMEHGNVVFQVLEVADGETVSTITPELDQQVLAAFVSLEDMLVVVTAETVSAFDLATGHAEWRLDRTGPIGASSVQIDLGGLYLAQGSRVIEKLNLCDGRTLWESPIVGRRSYGGLTCTLHEGQLFVASERGVYGWDAGDGRLLWEDHPSHRANYEHVFVADRYVVAIDAGPKRLQRTYTAHFYDMRDAVRRVPAEGARLELSGVDEITGIMPCDGALVVQSGNTIHVWAQEQATKGRP